MAYYFPFGQELRPLVQEDRTPKKVFVLGVYASAVHARWQKDGETICQALAVASEPEIFWDGNLLETHLILNAIDMPEELGRLVPASRQLNGPSARVLEENILSPLGYARKDAWLCDCLPETRLNPGQVKAVREKYEPLVKKYHLNPVTIPERPRSFCDAARSKEITAELMESEAELLILLGDIPIGQYLRRAADVPYATLGEYVELYGYGTATEVTIQGKTLKVLPLAHPRQIGGLGAHSEKWFDAHKEWEKQRWMERAQALAAQAKPVRKKIIRNAIRCNLCGDEIESRYGHEYVPCRCGACAVDGGHEYLRRTFKSAGCYTELSVEEEMGEEE